MTHHLVPKPIILFDLDGTLVDSFADIHAALSSGLQELGFPTHDLNAVKGMVGHGMRNLVQQALPPNQPVEIEDALIEATLRYYSVDPCRYTKPFAGMPELLAELHGIATLGILSNKPHALTLQVAEGCGLSPRMTYVQGQQEGIPIKPNPEAIWSFLPEVNRPQILLVGDGEADAQLSKQAGIGFIGVAWGTSPVELLAPYGPVAKSMGELNAMILKALAAYSTNGEFPPPGRIVS